MRYLVKAAVRSGRERALVQAIDERALGRGSIAGDEYLHNMEQARVDNFRVATWVETCFCDPPLAEERPYWEEYFELMSVKDAHSRRVIGGNSSFIIRASSLVASCFIPNRSKRRSKSKRLASKHIYAS